MSTDLLTPAELRAKYELLAHTLIPGTLVPARELYETVARDLAQLEATAGAIEVSCTTKRAGSILGLTPKTIAHYCEAGKFANAYRTGPARGKWLIPLRSVIAYRDEMQRKGRAA